MDVRGRDGGETREAVLGAETAELAMGGGRLGESLGDAEREGLVDRGEKQALEFSESSEAGQALALSSVERQNEQAEAASVALAEVGERVLGAGMGEETLAAGEFEEERDARQEVRLEQELGQEKAAIFSQERIENEVARETGLISGENVEQAGAETELLVAERKAEDNYDIATEQGRNGREAQKVLISKNESLSDAAKREVGKLTGMDENNCNLMDIESVYSSLRNEALATFGRKLGDRN